MTALLLLLLAGAGASAEAPRNPQAFVHLMTRPWFTLDPAAAFDTVSLIPVGNVYEPLIAFKSLETPDEFVPFLASSVPSRANGLVSADGREYRFPIRKGVRFHDGSTLTPEDVRYSLLRFMLWDPPGGPSSLLLEPVLGVYSTRTEDGALAVDFKSAADAVRVEEDSVVVRLKEPCGRFLKVLASLPLVVSRSWAAELGEWDGSEESWKRFNGRPAGESRLHGRMNGTGPYRLDAAEEGRQLVLKSHEGYWRGPGALAEVYLRVVPNKAVRLWMLETGDADGAFLEDGDYAEARELSGVRVSDCEAHTTLGETLFFTFSVDPASEMLGGLPPDFFSDRDVRLGFAHAFDYEAYLRRGLGRRGKRAAGPFPDAFLDGQAPSPVRHDPEKARAAFKRARGGRLWDEGFSATLVLSPAVGSRRVLAEILRASLAKVNPKFELRVKTLPSRELYSLAEAHKLPLFIAGYDADYPDPHSLAFGLLHSAGYFPRAQRFSDPESDRLIAAAARSTPREAALLYRELSERASSQAAQIYTYNPTRFRAFRDWVRGDGAEQNVNNLNLNNLPYFYAFSKGG